jgi:hypothetical protein
MFVFSMLLCHVCIRLFLTFCRMLMMGYSRGRLKLKKGRMTRTSPRWMHSHRILSHATSRLQLSCHVWFGCSRNPSTISVMSPSYGIETWCIRMRWKGDDDVVVLVLVLAPEDSWIILCDHDKVLRHLFGPIWPCIVSVLKPRLRTPPGHPSTLGFPSGLKLSSRRRFDSVLFNRLWFPSRIKLSS